MVLGTFLAPSSALISLVYGYPEIQQPFCLNWLREMQTFRRFNQKGRLFQTQSSSGGTAGGGTRLPHSEGASIGIPTTPSAAVSSTLRFLFFLFVVLRLYHRFFTIFLVRPGRRREISSQLLPNSLWPFSSTLISSADQIPCFRVGSSLCVHRFRTWSTDRMGIWFATSGQLMIAPPSLARALFLMCSLTAFLTRSSSSFVHFPVLTPG
mmetsp:Transcript_26136/g.62110  ORF Transcript_26136/g.62110 Transcript_26136/m.62110 type:complete len:209 (-) Transcript_26136:864-1490(-)